MSRMRRRRKKRSQLSVSLFPFLAVLICTLGVLIVMLVMAVKSADDQAAQVQSEDDADKQAQIAELQDAFEMNQLQIRGIKQVRPAVLERLDQSRAHRSYLEDEIRKLKREFEIVGAELVELERQKHQRPEQLAEFSKSDADIEIESLQAKVAAAKIDLNEKRETVASSGPSAYVIVPHKGGGGTFRRPIYIECTQDAITLQPSGIRLNKNEFVPPLEPGNMLDSALLANREYWKRYDLAGAEGNPYPLIVVRPDGAETFVLARLAMKSWDDEFGYELVNAEKKLDFGSPDTQLTHEIKAAIESARRRQRARAVIAKQAQQHSAQLASYNSRPGLTASGRYGGFVSNADGMSHGRRGGKSQQEHDTRNENLDSSNDDQNQFDPATSKRSKNTRPSVSGQATSANSADGVGGDLAIQNPHAESSLAKQRGSNWALPSQTPGATGYRRPIRLHCGPDFLELQSVNGEAKRIPWGIQTASAVDPLVDEIWKKIESWGISGANSFWKPQLRISILPGGETRFAELKGLLYESGLLVEEFRQ